MNNFYKYYDTIFHAKGYDQETDLVFKLSDKFGIKEPQKVLEVGCGTGNHTKVLSQKGVEVIAIDNDQTMIKLAKEKLSESDKLKIIYTNIEDLNEDSFDLALAMFNVITYIDSTPELNSFIRAVYQRLNRGGIFAFDLWNGIAAIKDPPQNKQLEVSIDGKKMTVSVNAETNFMEQKTKLTYQIKDDSFSFNQTLWTPIQVEDSLKQAGFEVVSCSPIMDYQKKATEEDWKIMFVAKKT